MSVANAQSSIFLVDNTPSKPAGSHVYSNLQTAINAAKAGDIIHVKPSSTSYGNISITGANDSITIYGIGLNPDKEILLLSTIGGIQMSGAYNVKMAGLEVTSTVYIGYPSASCANLSFENCRFTSTVNVSYSYSTSNVLFRNCLFDYGFNTSATLSNNTVVNNCIFSGYNGNGQVNAYNGTLFSHCIFFGNTTNNYNTFSNVQSCTVSNCIFYGRGPGSSTSSSNTTFNNCYGYGTAAYTFPTANGNSVNGTITSVTGSPFTSASVVAAAAWDITWDPTPVTALSTAGDDGTAVGVTGGTIPFSNKAAPLPYIKSLIVPSVIKQGDNLNVKVNALGN